MSQIQVQTSETIRQFAKNFLNWASAEDSYSKVLSRLIKSRNPFMREIANLKIKDVKTELFTAPPEQVVAVRDKLVALTKQANVIKNNMAEKTKELSEEASNTRELLKKSKKDLLTYATNKEIIEIAK